MRFVANAAFRLNANPVVEYARGEIHAAPTDAKDTAIFSTNGLHLYGSKYIRAANSSFRRDPARDCAARNLSNSTPQGDGNGNWESADMLSATNLSSSTPQGDGN